MKINFEMMVIRMKILKEFSRVPRPFIHSYRIAYAMNTVVGSSE